jgi:flagellar hook protein FlgE
MIQSMYTAISALQTHQQLLAVVANNLGNVNTVAYKTSRAIFQDTLSQTLASPTAATATTAGTNGIQIGLGVSLGTVTPMFDQGSLQSTGVPTDLAIEGKGFFAAQDPATGSFYYTRAGAMSTDTLNRLVLNPNGFLVLGSANGGAGEALGPITIASTDPLNPMVSFSIGSNGKVDIMREDGTTETAGYIDMTDFANAEALKRVGMNMYEYTPAAGTNPVAAGYTAPGQEGRGLIRAGYLEMSNVDLAREFTSMITAQRGLQASSRIITTSDDILQELINMKR